MRRLFGLVGAIFLLVSILLLGTSQFLPRLYQIGWEGALETAGQVAGFSDEAGTRPIISFVASDGDPYIFEAAAGSSPMRPGQMVAVRYVIAPEFRASVLLDIGGAQLTLNITGCALLAIGLTLALVQARKDFLRRELVQYGTRAEAQVVSIDTLTHIRFGRLHPYQITCKLRNPQGIGEWVVKSDWVWHLPAGLQPGASVPVLVDMYRPGQYCVLVDAATPCP